MAKRRTGYPSLAYTGVRPRRSSDIFLTKNDPTVRTKYFSLGTFILNIDERNIFMLVSKENGLANWKEFDITNSSVNTLTGNTGDVVTPDMLNINIVGGSGFTVTGNNSVHSLTVDIGGEFPAFYQTDNGIAEPQDSILNMFGGNSIFTTGAGNTITLNVTGTTNHTVQTGSSTNSLHSIDIGPLGYVLRGNSNSYPLFDQLGSKSNLGFGPVLAQGNNPFIATDSYPLSGSTYIGSTGNPPVVNTLTAGESIFINNGPGTITITTQGTQPGDFESGTWTPIFLLTPSQLTPSTYTINNGWYQRVKNLVYIYFDIELLQLGESAFGSNSVVIVKGLPFPGNTNCLQIQIYTTITAGTGNVFENMSVRTYTDYIGFFGGGSGTTNGISGIRRQFLADPINSWGIRKRLIVSMYYYTNGF